MVARFSQWAETFKNKHHLVYNIVVMKHSSSLQVGHFLISYDEVIFFPLPQFSSPMECQQLKETPDNNNRTKNANGIPTTDLNSLRTNRTINIIILVKNVWIVPNKNNKLLIYRWPRLKMDKTL
jgi:hypothetical protein